MKNLILNLLFITLFTSCLSGDEGKDPFQGEIQESRENESTEETKEVPRDVREIEEIEKVEDVVDQDLVETDTKKDISHGFIELNCSHEAEDFNVCNVSDDKNLRVVDFKISDDSSEECFSKGNLRVRLLSRKIRVKNGCKAKVFVKLSKIDIAKIGSDSINSNDDVTSLEPGELVLPERIVVGEFVSIERTQNERRLFDIANNGLIGLEGGFPVSEQFNHNAETGEVEAIALKIEDEIKVRVSFSHLYAREGERAIMITLDENGEIIKRRVVGWGKKHQETNRHERKASIQTKGAKVLLIFPYEYKKGFYRDGDSSDFFIKEIITFKAGE